MALPPAAAEEHVASAFRATAVVLALPAGFHTVADAYDEAVTTGLAPVVRGVLEQYTQMDDGPGDVGSSTSAGLLPLPGLLGNLLYERLVAACLDTDDDDDDDGSGNDRAGWHDDGSSDELVYGGAASSQQTATLALLRRLWPSLGFSVVEHGLIAAAVGFRQQRRPAATPVAQARALRVLGIGLRAVPTPGADNLCNGADMGEDKAAGGLGPWVCARLPARGGLAGRLAKHTLAPIAEHCQEMLADCCDYFCDDFDGNGRSGRQLVAAVVGLHTEAQRLCGDSPIGVLMDAMASSLHAHCDRLDGSAKAQSSDLEERRDGLVTLSEGLQHFVASGGFADYCSSCLPASVGGRGGVAGPQVGLLELTNALQRRATFVFGGTVRGWSIATLCIARSLC